MLSLSSPSLAIINLILKIIENSKKGLSDTCKDIRLSDFTPGIVVNIDQLTSIHDKLSPSFEVPAIPKPQDQIHRQENDFKTVCVAKSRKYFLIVQWYTWLKLWYFELNSFPC